MPIKNFIVITISMQPMTGNGLSALQRLGALQHPGPQRPPALINYRIVVEARADVKDAQAWAAEANEMNGVCNVAIRELEVPSPIARVLHVVKRLSEKYPDREIEASSLNPEPDTALHVRYVPEPVPAEVARLEGAS